MQNYGIMPDNIQRTYKDGFRNLAMGELMGQIAGKQSNGKAVPTANESGSGLWLIGLFVLILTAVFSVVTGGDAAGNANTGEPTPVSRRDGADAP
jgi:hypothetical protein